jgi:large conductance mechanosensitive channel
MKKVFGELKKFITRGSVIYMAVGVIGGSSFSALVNGMRNFILIPIINWLLALIFGQDSLSEIFTYLKKVEVDGAVDLAQSIYIDWGAFINAVINFFIVAFVLFTIVKIINALRDEQKKLATEIIGSKLTRDQKKELKSLGIKPSDKTAVAAYFAKKAEDAKAAQDAANKEAEEKARLEREANPTAEDLLKKILALLESKN